MKNLFIVLLFVILTGFSGVFAQKKEEKPVKVTGNLSLFYDIYDYSVTNYNTFRPRYENNIFRLSANASVQLGKHFSIPFGVNISNRKTSYNLPSLPEESVFDYIQNPRNNIHIDPKYKWIEGHIGSYTPNYSSLTTGDIQIFGVGIDINPGKFIFSGSYGKSQIAIEPDILLNIPGAYKQNIIAGRIGYGKIEGTKFVLNVVKIKDDINSVVVNPVGITPIEGITVSPLIEFQIGKKLTIKSETAASIYTEDMLSTLALNNNIVDSFSNIITINASSRADFAHSSSLQWKSKGFLIGGEIKYIGLGFQPSGYRNTEKDIIDYKINTGLKLIKKKLDIKGTFGIRTNNVGNTSLESTKRIISNMNVFAQITPNFSINANYANFGFNNNETNTSLRVELINNSFTISPNYSINTENKQHQISANISLNKFEQYDTILLGFVDTDSNTYNANYIVTFKDKPLFMGANILYLNNTSTVTSLKLTSFGVNAGYSFFEKKLKSSLSASLSNIKKDAFSQDNRLNFKLKFKYKLNKKLRFKLSYKFNNNKYGSSRPGAVLNENKIQFAIFKKL